MEKIFIENRKSQKICVLVEKPEKSVGLAFVMHGLGGYKEQDQIRTFAKSFVDNNYTVVSFDATNSCGESDGDFSEATVTNYYEDLEDVIGWAKTQNFYQEPFIFCGHSMGGMCEILYAEKYPEKIKALAPLSTGVSGDLLVEASETSEIDNWKKTGWMTMISHSTGKTKKLRWQYVEDRSKYNILPNVGRLSMPIIMMVGDLDNICPIKHQQILFDVLPGRKEFHIIKGAHHTYRETAHLKEIYLLLGKWLRSLN